MRKNTKLLAILSVFAMLIVGTIPFMDSSDATVGDGGTFSYTLVYNSSEMGNTAAQETQLTVANMTPISHAANTTTLTALANQGSWTWDYNQETHEGSGLGPFNSFYAAFDIDNGNAFVTKLNPYNLGKDLTGTDLPSGNYNIMWVLPTVYWKVVDGNVTLTNDSTAGGTAYAHTINGHVYNYIAIGVYHGSTTTIDGSTTVLTSKSGVAHTASQTRAVFRDQANNYTMDASLSTDATNNPAYSMLWNFYQWELYKLCCYTVMEGFNSQMIVGNGNVNGGNYTKVTGGADTLGPYAGNPGDLGASGSNAATYGQDYAKLFIEEAWGTVYDFVDGVVFNAKQGLYVDTSATPTDSTTAGGYVEYITQVLPSSNFGATISTSNAKTWGFAETTDASTDYYNKGMTDKTYTATSGSKVLYVGGNSNTNASASVGFGLSYAYASTGLAGSSNGIGSRLAFVFDAVPASNDDITIASNDTDYGTVSPTTLTVAPNSTITVSGNTLTIDGNTVTATKHTPNTAQYTYDFDHWSVSNGDTTSDGMTITAYFTRTVNLYDITVQSNNTNYGTVDVGSIDDVPYGEVFTLSGPNNTVLSIYNSVVTATASDPTTYYTYKLDGWTDDQAQPIVSGVTALQSNMTITANFSQTAIYTVLINPNDATYGSVSVGSIIGVPTGSSFTVDDDEITIYSVTSVATPSANTDKYTYGFTNFTINGVEVVTGTTISDNTTVIANFTQTINNYTVNIATSDAEAGSVSPTSIANVPYDTPITVNNNTVTINGTTVTATKTTPDTDQYNFAFVDWTIPENGKTANNTTITANFSKTLREYTITWNVDGVLTEELWTYGSTPTHTTPTKPGYQFNSWTPTVVPVTGNATYTATWDEVYTITLSYNTQGGSAVQDDVYVGINASNTFTVTDAIPTKGDNAFNGWNTLANGTGTSYAAGDEITVNAGSNVTLYAQWIEPNFILNYNSGSAINNPPSQYYFSETDQTHTFIITDVEPIWYGHELEGWSTTYNGEVEYNAGDSITVNVDETVTLYAVWGYSSSGQALKNILNVMPILIIVGILLAAVYMIYTGRIDELNMSMVGIAVGILIVATIFMPIITSAW